MTVRVSGSRSLKDKRQVVKSQLETIRNRFNVSAAEVDLLDSRRDAELAFSCVSNEQSAANRVLDKVRAQIDSNPLCEILKSTLEFV